MKKSLIAASASAVALAAMPVIGVFAEPTAVTTEVQDTIEVEVAKGCHFTTTRTNVDVDFQLTPGQTDSASTDALSISCNDAWTLTVLGTDLTAADTDSSQAKEAPIASTSGAMDGSISNYKLQLTPGTATGMSHNNFATAKQVSKTSPGETAADGTTLSAELTLTPTYSVAVGHNQPQGTYTGTVTYTIAAN